MVVKNIIKTPNTSNFWSDLENELVWFFVKWDDKSNQEELIRNQSEFIYKYSLLTIKYGILIPNFDEFSNLYGKILQLVEKSDIIFPTDWIPLNINKLYIKGDELLCSSILFTQKDLLIKPERIVNVDLLYNYDNVLNSDSYAYPINFCFFKNYIYLTICNDIFFLDIINPKTISNEITNGFYVDNSELAYLNTPRFNSFLRDFKILCFEFSATEYISEVHDYYNHKESISENGILFNNEIIYYEDIYDLLPENLKYKEFENIKIELDDTNYKKYIENKSYQPTDGLNVGE